MLKVTKMENIKPGNPFLSDAFNMGVKLGLNVYAMMGNFEQQVADYIIIVNTDTGERVQITFK